MRPLITALSALAVLFAVTGPARAERWVQLAPWIYLDLDSIRHEGQYVYYVVAHSSQQNVDPRSAGTWSGASADDVTRLDCSNGELAWLENGQWVVQDQLMGDERLVDYVC